MGRFFFALFCFFCSNLNGQGIQFFEGTWEEVLAIAKEENKEVFVDIYTTWCGPCKKLVNTTFKDVELGNYINQRFIAYKIEAENGSERSLPYAFSIGGYPVMIFFDAYGIQKIQARGFKKPKALLEIARYSQNQLDSDPKMISYFKKDTSDLNKKDLLWLFDHFDQFQNPKKSAFLTKLHDLLSDQEKEDMKYDFLFNYPFLSEELKSFYVDLYSNPSIYNPDKDRIHVLRYKAGTQIEAEYIRARSASDPEAFKRILKRRMDYAVKTGQVDAEVREFLENGYIEEYIFKQENRQKGY